MRLRYPETMNPSRISLLIALSLGILLLIGCGSRFGDLPDFADMEDVDDMKLRFYAFLQPVVAHENARILDQRAQLAEIRSTLKAGETPGWLQRRALRALAKEYELQWDRDQLAAIADRLWRRIDVIPEELALVQAAKESGWGRSRFAVDYNNLFGHWCYERGCGVVPKRRPAGATHEVESFRSVSESVRRYMNNLNTHERYASLRRLRQERRQNELPLTGTALAPGLLGYSERGEPYVEEVLSMVRKNQEMLDSVTET